MSSAAARQRLCRQHFTAANERIKLNPTDQATSGPLSSNVRVKIMRGQKASG